MLKKIFAAFAVITVFSSFFYINEKMNYPLHVALKGNFVSHPEFIPQVQFTKITSSWFDNLIADFYWLYSIQYVWENVISWDFKKYLYILLNFITDLNPNFTYPYKFWELILPTTSKYEKTSLVDQKKYTLEARDLGLKWIQSNCDLKKIEKIKSENDLKKIWENEEFKDPCKDPMIPYHLAYIYYWWLQDPQNSSLYYKITWANNDAPSWSRTLAAIMAWKSWNRQKSIFMFLSLAWSIDSVSKDQNKQDDCNIFSSDLKNVLAPVIFSDNFFSKLNWNFVKKVEYVRAQIIKQLWEENVDFFSWMTENYCSYYLNKAVRELNLGYIEEADKNFFKDKQRHAIDPEELLKNKYINYLPEDFQKWKEGERVIYFYNDEIKSWDYKTGR